MKKIHFAVLLLLLFSELKAQKGMLVVVQQRPDSVAIFDLNKGVITAQLLTGPMPHEVCYDEVSKRCFITNFGVEDYDHRIGTPGNSFSVLDPFAKTIVRKVLTRPDSVANCPHGIKIRPGVSRELFVNIEIGDSMLVYDADQLILKRRFPIAKGTHNFIFSESGDSLWAFAGENGIYLLNPADGAVLQHKIFSSPIRGLAFIDGNILASGKNEIFILSGKSLSVLKHFGNLNAGQILYSAATNDAKYIIAPSALENLVLIIDAHNGKVLKRFKTDGAPINVLITNDVAYVTEATGNYLAKINLKTFAYSQDIKIRGGNGIALVQ